MAEEAGTDADDDYVWTDTDDACAWAERLGWAFGLIAEDPAARGAALVHLAEAQRKVTDALARYHEMWRLTQPLGVDEQYREPAFRQALQRKWQAQKHSLPDGVWNSPVGRDLATWPGLPYALLFLEWEARYPLEWTQHAKAWGTKQSLIREVARAAQEEAIKAKLTDLVELVVHRAYRCKDREYVRVARAVDSADLRDRLDRAADSDSPWARCHAGYVLWLLDRPDLPNTRRVWQTWVAGGAASLL
ncbi:hypothetical protein [Streptomyces sp. NBC_00151]|uniref:hypothetical protein n=1 Tax=Streptomyces sp. NBC_00151 TaxID=2975669 RepID=UPI002DD80382|nr:hypothetical protein [Streptomyces sp. NBC_00151]